MNQTFLRHATVHVIETHLSSFFRFPDQSIFLLGHPRARRPRTCLGLGSTVSTLANPTIETCIGAHDSKKYTDFNEPELLRVEGAMVFAFSEALFLLFPPLPSALCAIYLRTYAVTYSRSPVLWTCSSRQDCRLPLHSGTLEPPTDSLRNPRPDQ